MLSRSATKSRLSRTRDEKRPAWKIAEAFLQWLRGRPCAVYGCSTGAKMQAAHVPGGDAGTGTKASDRFAIPLCAEHHRNQHDMGWKTFAARLLGGRDPVALAAAYWRAWPGRAAWEREQGVR